MQKFKLEELNTHLLYLQSIYKLENDIFCDKLTKDILKELSPKKFV
jgi:hypothetical protein